MKIVDVKTIPVARYLYGQTTQELVQGCIEAKANGFTAVGHLTPFLDKARDIPFFKTHADKMHAPSTACVSTVKPLATKSICASESTGCQRSGGRRGQRLSS